mmetsp:Transcript_11854/g.32627  ORF Transcript_11854/g.32627 Transcript_11854/m.32627 type:complete len:130 (-) Transcript_11854:727-1116(-)
MIQQGDNSERPNGWCRAVGRPSSNVPSTAPHFLHDEPGNASQAIASNKRHTIIVGAIRNDSISDNNTNDTKDKFIATSPASNTQLRSGKTKDAMTKTEQQFIELSFSSYLQNDTLQSFRSIMWFCLFFS